MKITLTATLLAASFAGVLALGDKAAKNLDENVEGGRKLQPPNGPPPQANRPDDLPDQASDRAKEVFAYWTPARRASAIPRDLYIDKDTGERRKLLRKKGERKLQSIVADGDWTFGGKVNEAAGRLLFNIGNVGYVCSASVIDDGGTTGRSLLATAGHCVYPEGTGTSFYTNFLFIPRQDDGGNDVSNRVCGDDYYGCWAPSSAIIDSEWHRNNWFTNAKWDYAILVVPDSGAFSPGYGNNNAILDEAVEPLQVDFDNDQELGDGSETQFLGYSYNQDPNFRYCRDPETDLRANGWFLPSCQLSGGASGGPCQPDRSGDGKLFSVVSWGYNDGSPGMGGPRLHSNSFSCLYNRAKTATSNTIVNYATEHGSTPCDVGTCTPDGTCTPNQSIDCGSTSGTNSCGGSCTYVSPNSCSSGETCTNNVCVEDCIPNGSCDAETNIACGTSFGQDNCGATCSYQSPDSCQSPETCTNNVCVCDSDGSCSADDTISCGTTSTGVDNCGTTCSYTATCQSGETCDSGTCVLDCSSYSNGGSCKNTPGCRWRQGRCTPSPVN